MMMSVSADPALVPPPERTALRHGEGHAPPVRRPLRTLRDRRVRTRVTSSATAALFAASLFLGPGAMPAAGQATVTAPDETAARTVKVDDIRATLSTLASDEFQGRRTGTPGAALAAHFIADRFYEYGLMAGGNDGYFQRIPLAREATPDGRERFRLLSGWSSYESVPVEDRVIESNVVGFVRGSDPLLRDEAVLVVAHYDHLGIGPAVDGDSIYNGADDDASGVVALLEAARAIANGEPPRRTVVFLAATGEEMGFLGAQWYIRNPVHPLRRTVAVLAIEMIGRPDPLAGGHGMTWLTGYERSTMGELLAEAGVPVVADPRPEMNFFMRSDNIVFAYAGIPAHTISSYNMHTDYHTPFDEVDRIDFEHMAEVTEAVIRAVRTLADGEAPRWHPGGRPEPRRMP